MIDPLYVIQNGDECTIESYVPIWDIMCDMVELYAIHPDWYGAGQILFITPADDFGYIATVFTDEIFTHRFLGLQPVWELRT